MNTTMTKSEYVASLRPGQRVSFLLPSGTRSWKATAAKIVFAMGTHVVVNLGGRHGTPAVVTPENVILPNKG